jgi:hypothetical protein
MKIEINKAQLADVQELLEHIKNGADTAMRMAINDTVSKERTDSNKAIREQVKLPAGYVKEKLKVRKATRANVSGAISAESRGTPMTRFPYTAYKRGGVGVQIKPAGGKQLMPGAFLLGPLMRGRSIEYGTVGIFIRKKKWIPKAQQRKKMGRFQGVRMLYSPSTSQVFIDVKDDLAEPLNAYMQQRLAAKADYLLKKENPPE